MTWPLPPYRPPDDPTARRHLAHALDLVDALADDDRVGAALLLARLRDDPDVDPWHLVIGLAGVAVKRPCSRPHVPEEG